ncbi:formate--tetrahydrofolate ligase [bacterium]|nr:formate--tetrahydrofolate ligase [bacterium]
MPNVPSDIDIAQAATIRPIQEVASQLGLEPESLDLYGHYKAKVGLEHAAAGGRQGHLVLVTALNPTPAGEGKTTVSCGLAQALKRQGRKVALCLREPSLGPVMGIKGGAAGGGYAQVIPMEDINLHFTGDIHAVTAAHNLLSALIDNQLQQGNPLGLDPRRVTWPRAMDMNDRALRNVTVGLGGPLNGVPREEHFIISVASEVMAILCLACDLDDLSARLGRIIVGYTFGRKPVTAGDLEAHGAMAMLLKDALKPNLVQTLENGPAFVHGGPFANIAHGCNSLAATRTALALADWVVTEAGFGAELGAEKFFDIKCRAGALRPECAVLVASARALKHHGGAKLEALKEENLEALERGLPNLEKHLENLAKFGVPVVVALNRFVQDSPAELDRIADFCAGKGASCALAEVWEKGAAGGMDLADKVVAAVESGKADFRVLYELEDTIRHKIETLAGEIYGAEGVDFTIEAKKQIQAIEEIGLGGLPVCVAKTQYSLSDNPLLLGRPRDFRITVRAVTPSAGAGFLVALTGEVMTMPGLPKTPAAARMRVDNSGKVYGLF